MKLLCITDIHGDQVALRRILDHAAVPDAILLGGDVTNFGMPEDAERLVRLAQERCPRVLAVAGNCDSPEIDQCFRDLGVSLFGCGVRCGDVGFYGVSAMPPWGGTMYELTEEQIATALELGRQQAQPARWEVVLSHPPPRDTAVDRARQGLHVGSVAVRALIDQRQPALVVCGHIHEARGVDRLGAATIVNCGPAFQGFYAVAEVGERTTVELRNSSAR